MIRRLLCLFISFSLLSVPILPGKLFAVPSYGGKVLTIIVGYAPGGTWDKVARLLSKHLPKYLPGKPSIIVQNMPGRKHNRCQLSL